MKKGLNRFALCLSQLLFSMVTPFFLMKPIAERPATRRMVAACFGRSYRDRYDYIIDTFQGRYGTPLSAALDMAKHISGREIRMIADCGTGTGYATRLAAERFPRAVFLGMDLLEEMILIARRHCLSVSASVHHLRSDSFALSLTDFSVDMVMAMNTLPCFSEFVRVCRPGGVIIYVDSSARWIAGLAEYLVRRQVPSVFIKSQKVDYGFFIVIQTK